MAIPYPETPARATAGMSLSFFLVAAWSTNHYTLPIDIYGAQRSAFGVAALIFAYGAMQLMISSPLAWIIQKYGFKPVPLRFFAIAAVSLRAGSRADSG